MYNIGAKTHFRGNEITITTMPYELYGAMWQDGIDENEKTYTIPTLDQVKENTEQQKIENQSMQDGFSRLKKIQ